MAHSPQRKKRLRQNEKTRITNRAKSTRMKTEMKRVLRLVQAGDAPGAEKALPEAFKRIDKAAKSGVIHVKAAAHKKSQLARHVKATAKA